MRNLTDIAAKEGITIDSESLHVIAVKADGAMRDALTIFDQIVAFCGKEVRYEDVIRDLNVLDYEYYFKIIDNSLSGDYTSSLLLLDEILSKGFNALYFVSGLSSHLRDLLVCKNSHGSALLSLPPSLIERYREQAARCSVQFIFSSLNITMSCEASYRQSGNQRLLIEFALMRLAEKAAAALQPQPAVPQTAAQQTAPAATTAAAPVERPPKPEPAAPAPTAPAAAPAPAPEPAPAEAQKQPAPPRPAAKLPGLSLRNLISQAEQQSTTGTATDAAALTDEPLTFESMMNAWQTLADREKSSGRSSLATAMLHRSPGIDIETAVLTFFVSNSAQQEWIREKALSRMEAALRKELRNNKVKINVQIYESPAGQHKESTPYMPTDKAKFLVAKQPELNELVKDLELDVK